MRKVLMLSDREEISRGLAKGLRFSEIALRLGRNPSVVSREVARHGGRVGYRAAVAEQAARAARERGEADGGGALGAAAGDRVPAVARRLVAGLDRGPVALGYPDDEACGVSHEAIYEWIYAQPVSTLARELIRLRTGRTARRGGRRPPPAPRISEPRYLDQRPAEVEGRAVPGHWEGDLVIGKDGRSAVATLLERTSRFLALVPLSGRDALTVGEAVIAAVADLPCHLRRSLTWNCGAEMARHARITATCLPVYFAHPHSPWERGSNENLNRTLREYFPKGVDITADPRYLAIVAGEINDRPRKIHGWKKPSEIFTEPITSDASAA